MKLVLPEHGFGDEADAVFQRQGEMAAVAVGFQVAGLHHAGSVEQKAGHGDAVGPMIIAVLTDYPLLRRRVR
jgi:hypothetical protein